MAQYIDKSALVTEIERLDEFYHLSKDAGGQAFIESLLSFLDTLEVIEIGIDLGDPDGDKSAKYIVDTDTLEVKEVDLEKEIVTHLKECLDVKFPTTDIELIKKDVTYTAKKFFELGLKAQKGKEQ